MRTPEAQAQAVQSVSAKFNFMRLVILPDVGKERTSNTADEIIQFLGGFMSPAIQFNLIAHNIGGLVWPNDPKRSHGHRRPAMRDHDCNLDSQIS